MIRTSMRRWILPGAAFLTLVLVMSWRLWWPLAAERRAFNYDALWQYWGDLQFQIDAYRSGQLPIWNPYDRGGYPAHQDPASALLYPVNWALVGVGLVAGPEWWLVPIKAIFHLWLAALGVFAYLRRRSCPTPACLLGGALLVLTYPFSKTLWTALSWGMAWAPWMLVAVDAWAARPTSRRAAAVALATALCHLSWAPAASLYALMVMGPYGVWAIIHCRRSSADAAAWTRAAIRSGLLALGLFFVMVAAQVLGTAALVGRTVRAHRDLDFIGATAFGPEDLFGFLVPRLPGEMAYMGFMGLVWAAAALILRPDGRRLVLAGSAALGVLCAFGSLGPYLPALASGPTPFGLFRRAHRYLYVTSLPLSILAAEGLVELLAVEVRERCRRIACVIGLVAAVMALVFAAGLATQRGSPGLRVAYGLALVAAIVGGLATAFMVVGPDRLRRHAASAAVLILVADVYVARWPHLELNWDKLPATSGDDQVRALEGVPRAFRIYDREYVKYRPGVRLHVRDFGGYEDDPLALSRYALARDASQSAPRLLAHFNVRWLFESTRRATRKSPADAAVLRQVKPGMYEIEAAVPAVVWVNDVKVVADERAALAELRRLGPGRTAVLEQATARQLSASVGGEFAAGRIVAFRLDHLAAEIDAPGEGVVIVHEAFYPGWTATVDGQPAQVMPANVLWRAVKVGPGHHRIEMRYRARSFKVLAGLSLAAMAAAVILMVRPVRAA